MPFDVPSAIVAEKFVTHQEVPARDNRPACFDIDIDIGKRTAKVTRFEPKVPLQPFCPKLADSLDLSIYPGTYEAAKRKGIELLTVKKELAMRRYYGLNKRANNDFTGMSFRKRKRMDFEYHKKNIKNWWWWQRYQANSDHTCKNVFFVEAILKDKSLFYCNSKTGTQSEDNSGANKLKNGDTLAVIEFGESEYNRQWLSMSSTLVEPSLQCMGLGSLLLDVFAAIAQLNNKERMILLPCSEKAVQFYKKKGFSVDPEFWDSKVRYPEKFLHMKMDTEEDGVPTSYPLSPKRKEEPGWPWHKLHSLDPAGIN